MSLKVQRQDNLDKLFDKFAIGPDDKDKLTTKAVQDTIDEHAKRKENKAADKKDAHKQQSKKRDGSQPSRFYLNNYLANFSPDCLHLFAPLCFRFW